MTEHRWFRAVSPRTGEEFGPRIPVADPAAVDAAVRAAAAAATPLAAMEPARIGAALRAAADALDARKQALAALADTETALGTVRLEGEVDRTVCQLRAFAAMVEEGGHLHVRRAELAAGPARTLHRGNVPVGVVAVFAASNFPFAFSVAGGDTAAALAAGCPVVVKSHYGHPQTSMEVAAIVRKALTDAGLPEGCLTLVHGFNETSAELVTHPEVAAVGFTGSTAGGRALSELAASRPVPIPVFAEQGSVNPVVLAPSALADIDMPAAQLAASITGGWGQFCTKPGILLVPKDRAREFTDALIGHLAGAAPQVLLTAPIAEGFAKLTDEASRTGGVLTWRGQAASSGFAAAAHLFLGDAPVVAATPVLHQEIFGPAAVVAAAEDIDEVAAVLAAVGGSLTGTVHGDVSDPWVREAVPLLARRVGRLVHNGVPTGVAVDAAMQHGGPYPASSDSRHTSVGVNAVDRFTRPLAWQDFPSELLPAALR